MARRVVVADGDAALRWLLVDLLGEYGCAVVAARSVAELMMLVAILQPSMVLLDLMLPGARVALSMLARAGVPVVVTSTWWPDLFTPEAVAGLAKPFDIDDLFRLVDRFCGPG